MDYFAEMSYKRLMHAVRSGSLNGVILAIGNGGISPNQRAEALCVAVARHHEGIVNFLVWWCKDHHDCTDDILRIAEGYGNEVCATVRILLVPEAGIDPLRILDKSR